MTNKIDSIIDFDRTHLWHPYTSIENPLPVYPVKRADGCVITLQDGKELVDGMSSWWAAIHGYNHDSLNDAVQQQLGSMSHVMFGGFTHEPAVKLGKQLVELLPDLLNRIFYCDSGSVAVEVAMKMAMQYMHSLGKTEKKRFATIRGGYHGDTFHGMSVCDPVNGMHTLYHGVLPEYLFADKPSCTYSAGWNERDFQSMLELVEKYHKTLCAIILEPVVQGAGGMNFYHPQYLKKVRDICDEYEILLIADEIATGFGRTGKLFGCDHAEATPDIICLGKALTGGYMTMGAVVATEHVGKTISEGHPGVFMHGPTFMGNPLACSVASASLGLLIENDWQKQVEKIERLLVSGLEPCWQLHSVSDVRILGAIGVVELKNSLTPQSMVNIQKEFVEQGVWLRPFGKLIYLMPPYVISASQLQHLTDVVYTVLSEGRY